MGSIPSLDRRGRAAGADPRLDAAADRDPVRLRVPSALPARLRALPDVPARARSRRARSQVACWLYRRRRGRRMSVTRHRLSRSAAGRGRESRPRLRRLEAVAQPRDRSACRAGCLPAVADVTFAIGRRETFALVGESGSGKSTVAKMVVGLIPPTAGEVVIDGVSMTDPTQRRPSAGGCAAASRWCSRTPTPASIRAGARSTSSPSRSAPSDLRRARPDIAAAVGELLQLVGLDPADGAKYPHEFSGGQRQRIAIARALASQARIHRLRRADLGARRLGAGADPQPDARPAGRASASPICSSATISRWCATWRTASA